MLFAFCCVTKWQWNSISSPWWASHSRFAPSQWETALLCNDVSHWLGASLESALMLHGRVMLTWLSSLMTAHLPPVSHVKYSSGTISVITHAASCHYHRVITCCMETPHHRNAFRIFIGPLWGESTGHRWFTSQRTSNAEVWRLICL